MCNKLSKFVELLINFGATLWEKTHETRQLERCFWHIFDVGSGNFM